MTKHLRFLFIALLMAVWTGAWAQTNSKSVVCTLGKNAASCKSTGDCKVTWKYSSNPNQNSDASNGMYWAVKSSAPVTLTATLSESGAIINSISIVAYTNGTGKTVTIKVGGTQYDKAISLTKTSSTYTVKGESSGDVTLLLTSTTKKSHIIKTVTINYTPASTKTTTHTTFGDNYSKKTFTFVNGVLDGFTAPTAKVEPTEAQSAMEYWSDNENVVKVGTDGALTFGTVFDTEAKIYAGIKDGNATYEASSDYYTVVNTSNLKDPELAFKDATIDFDVNNIEFKSADHLNNPYKVAVKYSINPTSTNATINENTGVAEIYEPGEYTITATFAGDDTYQSATATFILNAKDMRQDATLAFDAESYNIDVKDGKFFSADHLKNPNSVAVKYAIAPTSENVEITADGEVTVLATGEYTITAKFDGNGIYKPATATCKLVVTDGIVETKTVTFVAGVDKGLFTSSGVNKESMTKQNVTIKSTRANFSGTIGKVHDYRFYKSISEEELCETTFSTTLGKITKIEFIESSGDLPRAFETSVGTYDKTNYVWTGEEKNVTFTTKALIRATKIIVTLAVPQAKDYIFDETKDNNIVESYENANVTLNRSHLVTDSWNTFCVPFAISAEEIATTWGDGTELRTFDRMSGNTMYFKKAESIEAGKPYLVKPTKVTTGDLIFNGVQTVADAVNRVGEGEYFMVGTYNAIQLAEDGSRLFLSTNNEFKKPQQNSAKMKGMRVYFEVPANTKPAELRANIDGVETGINAINGIEGDTTAPVYNLQGQCVGNSLRSLAPGIYVQGGKKYVVK